MQQNYTMRNCSNGLPNWKNAPYVFYAYRHFYRGRDIRHAVEKLFAVDHAGAMVGDDLLCPFCRTPAPTSGEVYKKVVMERVEVGDT